VGCDQIYLGLKIRCKVTTTLSLGITKYQTQLLPGLSLHNLPTKAKILESMIQASWKKPTYSSLLKMSNQPKFRKENNAKTKKEST